jgi:hypothetical protein
MNVRSNVAEALGALLIFLDQRTPACPCAGRGYVDALTAGGTPYRKPCRRCAPARARG